MKTSIIKMSNAYDFMKTDELVTDPQCIVDLKEVEGTRCYLDDAARAAVESGIERISPRGVHFIDSGNYHYLSLLFISKIDYKFDLLLVDNHPDMKAPSFGNITSCGGWVLEAIETMPNLGTVYMMGVRPDLIEELEPLPKQIRVIKSVDEIEDGADIYLSLDKDALDLEFANTDWDQGGMILDDLLDLICQVSKKRHILGADICGDTSSPDERSDAINLSTNKKLLDCLTEVL